MDKKGFIILGRSRTGSNLLKTFLNSHSKVKCYGEVIGNVSGDIDLTEIADKYLNKDEDKLNGFKLFYYHGENPEDLYDYIRENDIKVIHLKRNNTLRTVISKQIAKKTEKFKRVKSKIPLSEKQVKVDCDYVKQQMEKTKKWEKEYDEKFDCFSVYYENLKDKLDEIQDFLGVEKEDLSTNLKRQNPEPLEKLVKNYDELMSKLNTPKLSVLIVTRNKKDILKRTLDNLFDKIKEEDEVVVIDDGSTDGTKEMLKGYDVKVIEEEHKGWRLATLRNKGIEEAENNTILEIDDDIILPDGYIGNMSSHYDEETLVVGAYRRKLKNGDLKADYRDNNDFKKWHAQGDAYQLKGRGTSGPKMYNKKKMKEIGKYDEDYNYNWGSEDIDVGFRWFYSGGRIIYTNKKYATHLPHERRENKQEEANKNRKLLNEKQKGYRFPKEYGILLHVFTRFDALKRIVNSIQKNMKNYRLYISDAGKEGEEKDKFYNKLREKGHVIEKMEYDSNWTEGRQMMAKKIREDYFFYFDVDLVVPPLFDPYPMFALLDKHPEIGIVGAERDDDFIYRIEENPSEELKWGLRKVVNFNKRERIYDWDYVDVIPNFWLARTDILDKGYEWDTNLNIGSGHIDFFVNGYYNSDYKVAYTPETEVKHEHVTSDTYNKKRRRKKWRKKLVEKWDLPTNKLPKL